MTTEALIIGYALKINGRSRPREVDINQPLRLTWRLRNAGAHTSDAFRAVLREASDAVVWDSGWRDGDETSVTAPAGILQVVTDYTWRLELRAPNAGISSSVARFTSGVVSFSAQWIRRNPQPWFDDDGVPVDKRLATDLGRSWRTMYSLPPLQVRTRIEVPTGVRRAWLYATSEGIYRTHLNGVRVGNYELTPGWTSYERRLDYQGYDVTDQLKPGTNVWSAEIADGWWSGYVGYHTRKQAEQYGSTNGFLGELHVELMSGEVVVHHTGPGWEEKSGTRIMADLLMGEYQDFTMETSDWMVGGDRDGWRPVVVGEGSQNLRSQIAEPVKVVKAVVPTSVSRSEHSALIDFGQNLVGRVRMSIEGLNRGDILRVRHGEMLEHGALYTENLRSAESTDVVVAGGSRVEFEPAFTFHGFRYASIEGLPSGAQLTHIEAQVLSSDLEDVGDVETSSPLVNQLISNIEWGQRGNFVGIPTDCNQRDERLGWTADAQIFTPTAALKSDISAFMTSWLDDMALVQDSNGRVPDVVPVPPTSQNFFDGAPAWGDAATIIPWHLYRSYGNRELLRQHFTMMRAWVDYVARWNPNGLWTEQVGNNYGDWLSVGADTPKSVVSLAYRIRSTDIVAMAARALGDTDLAIHYESAAAHLRQQFTSHYVADDGEVLGNTQAGYLFALAWRLVPDGRRARLAELLVQNIADHENLLTTGFLGANLLCPTLTELGHQDLAVDLLLEERFPSWGYSISQGATTIWERWDGWTAFGGFHTPLMNSFNHYSLGSVGEWIYRHLAGIDQHPNSVAYRHLVVRPVLTHAFDHVTASFESPRGRVASGWVRDHDRFTITLELPPGTTAEVRLPHGDTMVGPGRHELVTSRVSA